MWRASALVHWSLWWIWVCCRLRTAGLRLDCCSWWQQHRFSFSTACFLVCFLNLRAYSPVRTCVERWSSNRIRKFTVWGLLVYKVKLLPCYMDHFCFFDHKTSAGTRKLFGWLVRNRLYVHHHHLHHKNTIIDQSSTTLWWNFIAVLLNPIL